MIRNRRLSACVVATAAFAGILYFVSSAAFALKMVTGGEAAIRGQHPENNSGGEIYCSAKDGSDVNCLLFFELPQVTVSQAELRLDVGKLATDPWDFVVSELFTCNSSGQNCVVEGDGVSDNGGDFLGVEGTEGSNPGTTWNCRKAATVSGTSCATGFAWPTGGQGGEVPGPDHYLYRTNAWKAPNACPTPTGAPCVVIEEGKPWEAIDVTKAFVSGPTPTPSSLDPTPTVFPGGRIGFRLELRSTGQSKIHFAAKEYLARRDEMVRVADNQNEDLYELSPPILAIVSPADPPCGE